MTFSQFEQLCCKIWGSRMCSLALLLCVYMLFLQLCLAELVKMEDEQSMEASLGTYKAQVCCCLICNCDCTVLPWATHLCHRQALCFAVTDLLALPSVH